MQKLVENGKNSSRFTMPQRGGFRRQVRTATLKKPRNVYVYGSTPSPPRKRDRISGLFFVLKKRFKPKRQLAGKRGGAERPQCGIQRGGSASGLPAGRKLKPSPGFNFLLIYKEAAPPATQCDHCALSGEADESFSAIYVHNRNVVHVVFFGRKQLNARFA